MAKKLKVERFREGEPYIGRKEKGRSLGFRIFSWTIGFVVLAAILLLFIPNLDHQGKSGTSPIFAIFPRHLYQVEFLVNQKQSFVKNGGELVIHPYDKIQIKRIITDGWVHWGLKFISESFSDLKIRGKGLRLIDLWPLNYFKEPKEIRIKAFSWGEPIGEITILGELSYSDWMKLAEETDNTDTKIFYLEQAAGLPEKNVLVYLQLADLYQKKGEWKKVAKIYQSIAAYSDSKDITLSLLQSYVKSGQVDNALNVYLKVLKKDPILATLNDFFSYLKKHKEPAQIVAFLNENSYQIPSALKAPFYAYLGTLEASMKKWKSTIIHLQKAVDLGIDKPEVFYNLSVAYKEMGAYGQAKKYLRKYLAKRPGDQESQLMLTQLLQQEGEQQEAIDQIKKLISEDPNNLDLHIKLLRLLTQTGKREDLLKEYQEVIKLDPNNKAAWYNIGVIHFENKNWDESQKDFGKVLELDPQDLDAKSYMIQVLHQKKAFREMIPFLHDMLQERPEQWQYYDELYLAYDQLHDYKDMEKNFREIVKKYPQKEKLHQYLIYALLKNKKTKSALKAYKALIKIAPTNPKYLKEAARLYENHGYYTEALKILARLIKITPNDKKAQEDYLRVKIKNLKIKRGRQH